MTKMSPKVPRNQPTKAKTEKTQKAPTVATARKSPAKKARKTSNSGGVLSSKWVTCEACAKGRRVPESVSDSELIGFVCANNAVWDAARATCGVAEEAVQYFIPPPRDPPPVAKHHKCSVQ